MRPRLVWAYRKPRRWSIDYLDTSPAMKNTVLNLGRGLFAWLLLSVCLLPANAQSAPAARPNDQTQPTSRSQHPLPERAPAVEEAPAIGEVVIDARGPIVTVYETIAGHTPEQRA